MKTTKEDISRLIIYWLRHNPKDAPIEVDEFGWAKIVEILTALKTKNLLLDVEDIIEINNSFDKVRWKIEKENTRIKATHGHSIPVVLEDSFTIPPEELYHGTSISNIPEILKNGLLPMNRQFVHLSENSKTATEVAKRHGTPFIIEIETAKLIEEGYRFYKTSENVWLSNKIPSSNLVFRPWHRREDTNKHFINELRREVGFRKSHLLFQHLNDLELVWVSQLTEDCLFENKKTGQFYMTHLTYTTKFQEDAEECPSATIFNTFEEWVENILWSDQQGFYDS